MSAKIHSENVGLRRRATAIRFPNRLVQRHRHNMADVSIPHTMGCCKRFRAPTHGVDAANRTGAWMPLFIGDYLGDTMHLTTQEHGAYLLLLMNYWRTGPLPDDDGILSGISRVRRRTWKREVGPTVRAFFACVNGRLHHKRVDAEKAKAERAFDAAHSGFDKRLGISVSEWASLRNSVFCRDDFTCRYCGKRGGALECDHVLPIVRGGGNDIDNLATSCRLCNRDKGALLVSEWRPE